MPCDSFEPQCDEFISKTRSFAFVAANSVSTATRSSALTGADDAEEIRDS